MGRTKVKANRKQKQENPVERTGAQFFSLDEIRDSPSINKILRFQEILSDIEESNFEQSLTAINELRIIDNDHLPGILLDLFIYSRVNHKNALLYFNLFNEINKQIDIHHQLKLLSPYANSYAANDFIDLCIENSIITPEEIAQNDHMKQPNLIFSVLDDYLLDYHYAYNEDLIMIKNDDLEKLKNRMKSPVFNPFFYVICFQWTVFEASVLFRAKNIFNYLFKYYDGHEDEEINEEVEENDDESSDDEDTTTIEENKAGNSNANKKEIVNFQELLKFAIAGGDIEAIQMIEKRGASLDYEMIYGTIYNHQRNQFDWLFEKFPNEYKTHEHEVIKSCVMCRFTYGLLKLKKANKNIVYQCSSEYGYIDIVKHLVENYKEELKLVKGIIEAGFYNQIAILRYLLQNTDAEFRLTSAVRNGNDELFNLFVETNKKPIEEIDFKDAIRVVYNNNSVYMLKKLLDLHKSKHDNQDIEEFIKEDKKVDNPEIIEIINNYLNEHKQSQ